MIRKSSLSKLYENDCIFDKFEVCWSPDSETLFSGTYGNEFRLFNREQALNIGSHEIMKSSDLALLMSQNSLNSNSMNSTGSIPDPSMSSIEIGSDNLKKDREIDVDKKILHGSWHPQTSSVAVAAQSCLYIYDC